MQRDFKCRKLTIRELKRIGELVIQIFMKEEKIRIVSLAKVSPIKYYLKWINIREDLFSRGLIFAWTYFRDPVFIRGN